MISNVFALVRPYATVVLGTSALLLGGLSAVVIAADDKPAKAALPPGVIFSAPLADVPGHDLVVVDLKFPPTTNSDRGGGHRHPGSVYVYVTEGTLRLGIEGQPIQEVRKGQSFFEPPGVLHTAAESASSTEPASAIAVMIVPKGAALVMPAH
jgi:quercetin dioxygenase-like cupin family protein